ncbi:MAG TPA: ABC transporter permease [Solirubrobacterales bacterium]
MSRGPAALAWRRLRGNRVALAAAVLFALIVAFCLAAPLWSSGVAGTGPNEPHTVEKIVVDGQEREVVSPDGTPIGPVWLGASGKFFLGADGRLGRDEMVRLMYGGRTSLIVGLSAALLATLLAVAAALLAGYYRGKVDAAIARGLDLAWSFPVLLLGIALGSALAVGGLKLGPVEIESGSLLLPILIIGLAYTPYVARPLRGEVLALREQEFVEAAVSQGTGPARLMLRELLPNLWSTIVVFFTLVAAQSLLLEAALSFVGIGVQAPDPSWGAMISSGFALIYTSPLLTVLPGLMILLTVLSLNVLGDALRDALDPRSQAQLEIHTGSYEPELEVAAP